MQLSAQEIAELLKGSVEGDPDVKVSRPSKIEEGGPGTIAFLANRKYEDYAYTTTASILLVGRGFQPRRPISATLIRVADVYASVAFLFEQFGGRRDQEPAPGISEQAQVHPRAKIGKDVYIGAFAVVEENAIIGDNCRIHPQTYIGPNVVLGKEVTLFPGVRVLHDCHIGDHCVLHANVIVGSDGFGFAPQPDGSYKKIPQLGKVVIEESVEIGANTTIDRATLGATIIRKGVKLDNLIQVGHNVEIGEHTVIAAQSGIAGSTRIGKNCRIGGQVGIVGHLTIADGTQVQAQSGVASNIRQPDSALFGSPAMPYHDYLRAYAVFKELPALRRRLRELEKHLKDE